MLSLSSKNMIHLLAVINLSALLFGGTQALAQDLSVGAPPSIEKLGGLVQQSETGETLYIACTQTDADHHCISYRAVSDFGGGNLKALGNEDFPVFDASSDKPFTESKPIFTDHKTIPTMKWWARNFWSDNSEFTPLWMPPTIIAVVAIGAGTVVFDTARLAVMLPIEIFKSIFRTKQKRDFNEAFYSLFNRSASEAKWTFKPAAFNQFKKTLIALSTHQVKLIVDYRKFLKERYAERCRINSRYSLRAYARDLSVSPSTLSEVMNGKHGLSFLKAKKISTKLDLSPSETELFLKGVQASDARSKSGREEAQSGLSQTNTKRKEPALLTSDIYQIIGNVDHYAIIEYLQMKKPEHKPAQIAKALGIQTDEVEAALLRLTQAQVR